MKSAVTKAFSSKVFSDSAASIAIKLFGAFLAYVVQVYIANLLGAAQYGVFSLVISVVSLCAVLSSFGFGTASMRYVARYTIKRNRKLLVKYTQESFSICLLSSGIIAILLIIFSPRLGNFLNVKQGYVLLIAALLMMEVGLLLFAAYLQGAKKIFLSQFPVVIVRPLVFLAVLLLAQRVHFINEAVHVLIALVCVLIFIIIIYALILKQTLGFPRFKPVSLKEKITRYWLFSSVAFMAIAVFNVILSQMDIIMLAYYTSSYEVGIYSAAVKVASLVTLVLGAVNLVLAPVISELHTGRKMKDLASLLSKSAKLTTLGAIVAFLILYMYGANILHLFGADFIGAQKALIILLVAQVINTMAGSVGFLMNMSGNQNYSVLALGVSALINILANIILIPRYGIEGAAYATVVATLIWNMMLVLIARRRLRINTTCFSKGELLSL